MQTRGPESNSGGVLRWWPQLEFVSLALPRCGHYNGRFPSLLTSSDSIVFLRKTQKREELQSDALIMSESSLKQTEAQQQLSSGYETIANGFSFTSVFFFLGPQTCNNHHTPTAGTEKSTLF